MNNIFDLVFEDDNPDYVRIKQATSEGFIRCKIGGGVADLSLPTSKTRRGRVQENGEICPTLMTSCNVYRIEEIFND